MLGGGTIGLVTLQAALLSGIEQVALLEPQPERRERARASAPTRSTARRGGGARATSPPTSCSTRSARRRRARRRAAGAPGGQAVYIGLAADDTTLGFHGIVRGQLTLQGSYAYTMDDFEQAFEWLVSGQASLGELPAVRPLEDGPARSPRSRRPAARRR